MQKTEKDIVFIKVQQLYPHPDNPRKDVGDVSELAESIKKNGIMQNLTVIPLGALDTEAEEQTPANEISLLSDFHVLIGHRRLAACKKAGIEEVPCKIVSNISKREQVSIMLEENMQRNDLTIFEQAQGFQMMLDLGETAETIAEKTGFSVSTVYHRLNIAKLNQKELEKKEKDNSFQLSLTAIYELEKIENIKTRDKVLKEATDNQNLMTRARNAVRDEKRTKAEKEIAKMLKKIDVKQAPPNTSPYDGRYEKDDNLRLTLAVGEILEENGINVIYTRKNDEFVPLEERAEFANKKKDPFRRGSFFLLHCVVKSLLLLK